MTLFPDVSNVKLYLRFIFTYDINSETPLKVRNWRHRSCSRVYT